MEKTIACQRKNNSKRYVTFRFIAEVVIDTKESFSVTHVTTSVMDDENHSVILNDVSKDVTSVSDEIDTFLSGIH